jgi:cell division protein FtsX
MQPRLFYIIQVVYIVVAWLLFFEAIFIIPNAVRIEHRKVFLNIKIDSNELFADDKWCG